jgi:hypothetical protein
MSGSLESGEGLDGMQHPDCRACEERKRLNLGIMEENRQLRRIVDLDAHVRLLSAVKQWRDATESRADAALCTVLDELGGKL